MNVAQTRALIAWTRHELDELETELKDFTQTSSYKAADELLDVIGLVALMAAQIRPSGLEAEYWKQKQRSRGRTPIDFSALTHVLLFLSRRSR